MPVLRDILHCLSERNAATRAAIDPVHQLIDRGTRDQLPQLREEILLERLALAHSPAPEHGVCVVGEISDKHMRHSCIVIAPLPRTRVKSLERDT